MAVVSVVKLSELDEGTKRIDAEYYKPEYLQLEKSLKNQKARHLFEFCIKLDCSAFYPSITQYYNHEQRGVPFLRVDDIKEGLIELTNESIFLPEIVLEKNRKTIAVCSPSDIVIAKGGNTLAKVAFVPDLYYKYSTCRDLIILRTDNLKEINV